MRAHEVPTHVQAEDRVLLGFTFPQIVAMIAVCALAYGAYRYIPAGPPEARLALAAVLVLAGLAAVAGRIGGRRLPLAAADLLKFWLGPRRYAGTPAELVRSAPPAPVRPVKSGPGPLSLMARRARRRLRRLRKGREHRNGRIPLPRHPWSGKRRDRNPRDRKRTWLAAAAVTVVALAAATVPQAALADDRWRDETGFEAAEPVPGRRLFVEGLTVSGDGARVALRAAVDLDLRVRAYGGPEGNTLRFWGTASLAEGERIGYTLPLSGPAPSFTFSWVDGLGQAGAVTLRGGQIPHPLPSVEGGLCNVRVASLGWTPGAVEGVVASECVARTEERAALQTVAGYERVIETAVMEAEVTGIRGVVNVSVGGSETGVLFAPNGETAFRVPVGAGEAVHAIEIQAGLTASLRIPLPPLTRLAHRPAWTEYRTQTVSLVRPGVSRTVSETVSVTHDDGTTTTHVVSAHLSIPSKTVRRDVTLAVVHPARVEAEVVARQPISRSRSETLTLTASVGSDAPFEVLTLPEPEPEDESAEQTPLTEEERDGLFGLFGWRRYR